MDENLKFGLACLALAFLLLLAQIACGQPPAWTDEPPPAWVPDIKSQGRTWTWDASLGRYRPVGQGWYYDHAIGCWCRDLIQPAPTIPGLHLGNRGVGAGSYCPPGGT